MPRPTAASHATPRPTAAPRRCLALGLPLAALLSACGGSPPALVLEHSDSAGVAIISTLGPDRPLDWRFERLFSIGGADAGPASFYRLWPHGIGTDAAGNLFVLDHENHRVAVFDTAGRHLRSFGRRGGGPGEVQAPTALVVRDDGAAGIFDRARRGIVWFDAGGRALETQPIDAAYVGGRLAVSAAGAYIGTRERDRALNAFRLRLFHAGARDTAVLAQLDQPIPGPIVYESCGGLMITLPPLFAPELLWYSRDGSAAVAASALYRVDVFAGATRVRSLRRDLSPRAVTREMAMAAVGDGETWTWDGGRCTVPPHEVVEKRGFAAELPAVSGLAVAPDGSIWVRRTAVPGTDEPDPIDVLAPDGAYLGTLPAGSPWPVAFTTPDRLAAIEKDEFDVEYIAVYHMRRGPE